MSNGHISVCVCTFRRPELLTRLLAGVAEQRPESEFTFDVIVVDNDAARSAEHGVRAFASTVEFGVIYDVEPTRNISLARNKAVQLATGNLVAFIDDDEYPSCDWLSGLYRLLRTSNADGVLGPVVPDFPTGAPAWLQKGRFFDRPRPPSGSPITERDARTGNVLLKRSLFGEGPWFDPAFGRTGGEDSDFFQRQFEQGAMFLWCDEAVVHEHVPPERWARSYLLKRYLRSGTLDGEAIRGGTMGDGRVVFRNAVILAACLAVTPASLVLPQHLWMKVLRKLSYCLGVVTGYAGVSLLRERE